jgi:starvation-inducible outer membrane lipoprotein
MKKLIIFTFIMLSVLLVGCMKDPQEVKQNGNFQVELLFEQNGCKMYRFKDGGRYVYWSDCQGKVQSDYSTVSGKSRVNHSEESITNE